MVAVTEASGWIGGLDDGGAAEDELLDVLLMRESPVAVADAQGGSSEEEEGVAVGFPSNYGGPGSYPPTYGGPPANAYGGDGLGGQGGGGLAPPAPYNGGYTNCLVLGRGDGQPYGGSGGRYGSGVKRMQCLARDHSRRIFKENEKLRAELESKKKELDSQCEQLNMLVKREKEAALQKILLLEKQLDAKQRLELEIEQSKGKVEVMKHIKGTEDMGVKKLSDELKEKIEDLEDMEQQNQDLIVKEQKSHDELQEAHKELIAGLKELNGQSNIGVRRMGELDVNMFRNMCKKRFSKEETDNKVVELCSNWQYELEKPDWHPFKLVQDQKLSYKLGLLPPFGPIDLSVLPPALLTLVEPFFCYPCFFLTLVQSYF
ncbi:hypothetical protein Taro_040396, partial [Colocasia esculenta]|nr:hypothetical protein [Colocasia esculenta]